jgi:hypothetical protein
LRLGDVELTAGVEVCGDLERVPVQAALSEGVARNGQGEENAAEETEQRPGQQADEKASLQGRREKGEGRKQSNFSLLPFAFSLQAAFFSSLRGSLTYFGGPLGFWVEGLACSGCGSVVGCCCGAGAGLVGSSGGCAMGATGGVHAAHQRSRAGPAEDAQDDRADHEDSAEDRRGACEHGGTGACAKRGLAAASAERAGDVAAFALLQEHDEQEQQTGEHVQSDDQVVEHNG